MRIEPEGEEHDRKCHLYKDAPISNGIHSMKTCRTNTQNAFAVYAELIYTDTHTCMHLQPVWLASRQPFTCSVCTLSSTISSFTRSNSYKHH